jgi:hypothetical protein
MIVRHIKISELTTLISSPEYAAWNNLPISPARAISQSQNPNALRDDDALIIAVNDNNTEILGFIGVFPSVAQSPENTRVMWVSNWWVSELHRGKGIGLVLINSLMESGGKNIAFPDLTDKTLRIVEKLGDFHAMKRDGVILHIRPGAYSRLNVLSYTPGKFRTLAKAAIYTSLPWLIDFAANLLMSLPQKLHMRGIKLPEPVRFSIPEEKDFQFMKAQGLKDFHIPDPEELKMPDWLIKPDSKNRYLSEKYKFSNFALNFSLFWLRWEIEGGIKALVLLNLRDGVLKTQYVYCIKEYRELFPSMMLQYCFKNHKIRTFMTAHPILTDNYGSHKYFIVGRRNYKRYSAVSKELMKYFDSELVLQDGDGDYRFT